MVFDNHEMASPSSAMIPDGCLKMKSHTIDGNNDQKNALIAQSKSEVNGRKSTTNTMGGTTTEVVEVTNSMGNSQSTGAYASVAVQSMSSSDTAFMEGPRHDNRIIDDSLTQSEIER